MKKFKKYIPSTLNNNLKKINYPAGVTYEDCVQVCYAILRGQSLLDSKDDGKFVCIPTQIFINAIGDRKVGKKCLYYVVLYLLEDNGIVIANRQSISGVKSNEFYINDDQYDTEVGKLVGVEIESDYLNKKTKKIMEKSEEDTKKRKAKLNASAKSMKNIHNLKYDYASAMDYLKSIYENKIAYHGKCLDNRQMQNLELKLRLLEQGNSDSDYRTFGVLQTNGRANTDISDLRSDFRQFIKGDNLTIQDISNSQPLLLVVLIDFIKNQLDYPTLFNYLRIVVKNNFAYYKNSNQLVDSFFNQLFEVKIPSDKDIEEYRKIVESGKFYEFIQEWFWKNQYDTYDKSDLHIRDNMKKKCFTMFYSDHESDVLKNVFPAINRFVESIKKIIKDISFKQGKQGKLTNTFPIVMQSIESLLWVQTIQGLLDEKGINYYGIHDSIIVLGSDKDIAEAVIKKVYNDYQMNPTIDVKPNNYSLLNTKTKKIEIKKKRQGIEGLFS